MKGMEDILLAKVAFGLVQQGHIPTIERMLSEGRTWEEIGREIGWCPRTAEEWYQAYLARRKVAP